MVWQNLFFCRHKADLSRFLKRPADKKDEAKSEMFHVEHVAKSDNEEEKKEEPEK